MLALLLVAALTVLTIAVARHLGLLEDVVLVIAASVLGGLVFLAAHPELSWVAAPRVEDGTCSSDEEPADAPPLLERVSVQEARTLLDSATVTFVDARPDYHYLAAHIPGAMNLPADEAEGVLGMQSIPIPPDGQVITYCDGGSCEQSEYLGLLLRERDVCQQVRVLDGGWQAWVDAQGPTVSGASRFGELADQVVDQVADVEPGADPSPEAAG